MILLALLQVASAVVGIAYGVAALRADGAESRMLNRRAMSWTALTMACWACRWVLA